MASNATINRIIISPLRMCRVCLSERRQVFIDVLGPNEPLLAQFVNEYYKVEIKRDDIHRGKSTKLCQRCMENIDVWRGHVDQASACQTVVNYLAEKKYEYMSSASSSQVVNKKRCLFISKKKNQKASRSKKRKRGLMPVHEIQSTSTSNDMIQSPLESIDESIQQSTSASILQIPSSIESVQYPSDFPSTSNSTEIIPFVPSSNKIIPFTSTSTEIISFTSTSTEIIPFTSTSTEIIPFTSTSTEIIPFTSTSTEIIQSTPTSTGIEPIWYTMANAITSDSFSSEKFDRSKSFKVECVCIFCTYRYNETSKNIYRNIMFCNKHSKPFACLIDNCNTVFPNKAIFIAHYRTHLNLNSTTFLCRKCMAVLNCPRRSITTEHVHQNLPDLLKCCSLSFTTMNKFVLHKLINHSTIVVTSNNRSRILKKSDPTVMSPKKCKIEPIDVKDDAILASKEDDIEINIGNYKCTYFDCSHYSGTVKEYVEHSKKKHNNIFVLKESGIKLCPLCDNNYFFDKFIEHIENCTNTMKIGDKKLNYFGCVYCKCIFTKLSASQFRNHFLFCKTFYVITIKNKAFKQCANCTFKTPDDSLAVVHASSNCIYFQLKMRYAMGPDEKEKALQRMEFDEENAKQQVNKNCTDNEALPGTSKIMCNTRKQYMLKTHNYYCNNCHNLFFDRLIFLYHMTLLGFNCRSNGLVYCPRCLTDFKNEIEYNEHLPKMPKASPLFPIKSEIIEPNYNAEDIIMESVVEHTNQNDNYEESSDNDDHEDDDDDNDNDDNDADADDDVKVFDMNHQNRYFQAPGVSGIDIRSTAQFPEQEVSNYDFSDQDVEFNTNDDYMQCVVEEKPDLNQMMIDSNMQ